MVKVKSFEGYMLVCGVERREVEVTVYTFGGEMEVELGYCPICGVSAVDWGGGHTIVLKEEVSV